MSRKAWDCPGCGKCFASPRAVRDHIKDMHPDQKGLEPRRRPRPEPRPIEEMSLADIAVEAEIKRNMGEPLDPLEESLLND